MPPASSTGCGPEVRFARDSPLEGDGFEPSVPGTKKPVFVVEGELRGPNGGSQKGLFLMRYRWFESISLQRRVTCEPDFQRRAATVGPRPAAARASHHSSRMRASHASGKAIPGRGLIDHWLFTAARRSAAKFGMGRKALRNPVDSAAAGVFCAAQQARSVSSVL